MTNSIKPTQDLDAGLAEFTDSILDGKKTVPASSSDAELQGLQETVAHLNRVFPNQALDGKTLRRMENDFKARAGKANPPATKSIWRSQQARQRMALAFAATLVLAIVIVAPILSSNIGGVQGTAGLQTGKIALFIILGGVVVLFIWLGRRK